MELIDYRSKVDKLLSRRNFVIDIEAKEAKALVVTTDKISDIEEARTIVQIVAQTIQQRVHTQIASVVSQCLKTVFDDTYEFKLRFEKKRGKTEASLVLLKDSREYDDLLNEVGGGVIDVLSLGLRLACVLLSKPLRRRLLILDEPFRNVRGKHNKQRLRELLLDLAKDMDFQFILNVDADSYPEFVLGKTVEMGIK
ncbi:MAG: hypothetical protein V1920_00735 [Bacillota bacterium]